jgi:hypothetical protein
MPRSKKSGAGQPPRKQDPSDTDAHEAAETEGMAHVRSDELAGSPDIFAGKKDATPASTEPASLSAGDPEIIAEPAPATPEPTIAPPPFAPAPPARGVGHRLWKRLRSVGRGSVSTSHRPE